MMRRIAFLVVTLLAISSARARAQGGGSVAIVGVTVVDGTTPEARRDWTVVVRDGRIAAAGPSREVRAPKGATVVRGAGKFLVPGLWDMHVHLQEKDVEWLPLLVAHGVTAARDVGTLRRADADSMRRIANARGMPAPRLLTAGIVVETPGSLGFMERLAVLAAATPHPVPRWRRGHLAVTTEAEAVAAADSARQAGATMLKFIDVPSRAVYDALARAAQERGLTLVGHTPQALRAVGPWHALDAGQRSFEHVYGIAARATDSMGTPSRAALVARMRERRAAFVPTLLVSGQDAIPTDRFWALVDDSTGALDAANRWVSAQERAQWRVRLQMLRDPIRPTNVDAARRAYDREVSALRDLHRLGATVLPGTDLGMYLVYPGRSMHEELALLAQDVGMTPFEALRSATLESARWAGVADSVGSVRAGQAADLVLLDADPLASVSNLARIDAVLLGGRLLDRAALEAIKQWRAR